MPSMCGANISRCLQYPADTVMYRSVGKMFLQATRAEIDEYHTIQGEKQVEKQKALSQKFEYLKKKANSQVRA